MNPVYFYYFILIAAVNSAVISDIIPTTLSTIITATTQLDVDPGNLHEGNVNVNVNVKGPVPTSKGTFRNLFNYFKNSYLDEEEQNQDSESCTSTVTYTRTRAWPAFPSGYSFTLPKGIPSNILTDFTKFVSDFPHGPTGSPTGFPIVRPADLPSGFPTGYPFRGRFGGIGDGVQGSRVSGVCTEIKFATRTVSISSELLNEWSTYFSQSKFLSGFPTNLPGFPTDIPKFPSLPGDFIDGFPTDFPGGFPTDLPGGFPTDLRGGFPTDLPGGFPANLPGIFSQLSLPPQTRTKLTGTLPTSAPSESSSHQSPKEPTKTASTSKTSAGELPPGWPTDLVLPTVTGNYRILPGWIPGS